MPEPYIGEIQIYGFSFPPKNWAFCDGSRIRIQQNTSLFSLIGTVYGGDGTTYFQLPNLAARQACSSGQGPGLPSTAVGEWFGVFSVALDINEMPAHNHGMNIYAGAEETDVPSTKSGIGTSSNYSIYAPPGAPAQMNPAFVLPAGAGQAHDNIQPYLGLNYSICLTGLFPSFG